MEVQIGGPTWRVWCWAWRWLSETFWEADEQQQQRLALASISARGQKTYCAQGASRMGGKRPVCTELTLIRSSSPTQACFCNNVLLQYPNKGGVLNKSSALITAGEIHYLSCDKVLHLFGVLGLIFFLIYTFVAFMSQLKPEETIWLTKKWTTSVNFICCLGR